jgi:O-antigen/teichoic acid export membrane protein
VAAAVVQAVGGLVLVVVVTRGFAPAVAGALFATTSAFLIVVALAQLGSEAGLTRWIAVRRVYAEPAAARRTLWLAIRASLVASLVVSVAGVALAAPVGAILVGADAQTAGVAADFVRILSVLLPVAVLAHVLLAATRGYGSMRPTVLAERLALVVLQLVGVSLAALLGADPVALVLGWALPYVVVLLVAAYWTGKLLAESARPAPAVPGNPVDATAHPPERLVRDYWAFTAPRIGVALSQVLLRRLDVVIVAAVTSASAAAVYTAATRFVVVGGLGVLGVQQALAPQLSAAFARRDRVAAQRLFGLSTAWMMAVSWPVYLVVAGLASPLLATFGPGYSAGAAVVVIGALGMLYGTAAGAVDTALVMSGHSLASLMNSVVVAASNVLLLLWWVPMFGIEGAAAAWATAVVLRNLLAQVQVRRLEGLRLLSAGAVQVAAAAVLTFGPAVLLLRLVGAGDTGWTLAEVGVTAAVLAAAGAVYAGVIWRAPGVHTDVLVASLRRGRPGSRVTAGAGVK